MTHILRPFAALLLAGVAMPAVAAVSTAVDPAEIAAAKTILMDSVGFDTVKGRGKVPAYAEYLKGVLVKGGFPAADISIEPVGETANLHLVWRGSGKAAPIALTGHMDVVEADPKDWVRNPFVAVEEDGYLFGRGVLDNKFDVAMLVETLVALKSEGFRPNRDIHLFLSGDEETDGATAALQGKQAKAAGVAFMLNSDGGGGSLDAAGKLEGYGVSAAEKTYADYTITVTNPGGHSSAPGGVNAIGQLARATARIDAYRFAPQINDITRASLLDYGAKNDTPLGKAALAFAKDPSDAAAIATLRASPLTVGQIGTTCVPTMVSGGHAPNALPQRAVLTVNCRIFPGTSAEAVRQELARVVDDKAVTVASGQEWQLSPPSPLLPEVMTAVGKAVAANYPGVVPVPSMDSGATDSVFYRSVGIPSYGVSGLYMRSDDFFAHGLNERVPVAAIPKSLKHWRVLIMELAK